MKGLEVTCLLHGVGVKVHCLFLLAQDTKKKLKLKNEVSVSTKGAYIVKQRSRIFLNRKSLQSLMIIRGLVLAEASEQVSLEEVVKTASETDCSQSKCRIKDEFKI